MPGAGSGPNRGFSAPEPPFQPPKPLTIGLVGGIAAGKSTVAGLFSSRGIRHVDADFHARAAAQDPEALAEIASADELGAQFVREGGLDRPALAEHVFCQPAAKARLEAILHPRVRKLILAELEQARAAGQSTLLDVPLLFEAGLWELCDTVVFVETSEATRRGRAQARGWKEGELARREANQLPLAEKRARSQHTIDNDGDLDLTAGEVSRVIALLEAS